MRVTFISTLCELADADERIVLLTGDLGYTVLLKLNTPVNFLRRLFGLDHAGLDGALGVSPPGARGLTFLPHLGGERTPNAPTGAGVFAGLRAEHTVEDLVRAVVEGVVRVHDLETAEMIKLVDNTQRDVHNPRYSSASTGSIF